MRFSIAPVFFLCMTANCCVHRKVVRRASLSDRHNLCRKEYETEAIVWRGGREEEPEKERESDQENNQIVQVRIQWFRLDSVYYCIFVQEKKTYSEENMMRRSSFYHQETIDVVSKMHYFSWGSGHFGSFCDAQSCPVILICTLCFSTIMLFTILSVVLYHLSNGLIQDSVTQNPSLSCRSNRSRLLSNQLNPGCRPFSKMALAHRMVSSPRRRPRRCLRPPMTPCWCLIETASPPRRRPGPKSAPKLCLSSRNRGLPPSCWITPCLMVTLATAPRTPSLMPNPTLRTPACPRSPPTGARFIARQPAATRRSLNWSSQQRRSSRRRRPAAVCRSCPVTWLRLEQEVLA